MTWKKTWFSYIIWAFYSIIISISMSLGIIILCSQRLNQLMIIGIVCLFFILWTVLYFLIRHYADGHSSQKREKKNLVEIINAVAAVMVGCISYFIVISRIDMQQLMQSEYIINSFVGDTYTIPNTLYGAEQFFLYLLRMLFVLLGNNVGVALGAQFFLQLMTSLFFYYGIRKTVGRIAAGISLWGMLLTAVVLTQDMLLQPVWMAVFFFSIGFYALATVFSNRKKEVKYSKGKTFLHYVRLILLGIYFAGIIYLDIYGILLVLLSISILWYSTVQSAREFPQPPRPAMQVLCLFMGALIGTVSIFSLKTFLYHLNLDDVIKDWWLVYEFDFNLFFIGNYAIGEIIIFILLCAVLFWGVLYFFKETITDSLSGIFLLLIGTFCLHILGMGADNSQKIWLFYILIFGAAVCLEQCLLPTKCLENSLQDVKEEKRRKEKTQKEETQKENKVAKPDAENDKPKIKMLENPLPGPKKHVPKTLDYTIQEKDIKNTLMDYDIEVSDDDDFDLK